MSDINVALASNRAATEELATAARQSAATWAVPPAPGKWSPSQVVEHVARSLEETANEVMGRPTKFPRIPAFLRPVVRSMLFKQVLKTGTFRKARTNKAMDPASGPATPEEARTRLESACAKMEEACKSVSANGDIVQTKLFGKVPLDGLIRFTELHTRHHRRQMPS